MAPNIIYRRSHSRQCAGRAASAKESMHLYFFFRAGRSRVGEGGQLADCGSVPIAPLEERGWRRGSSGWEDPLLYATRATLYALVRAIVL